MTGLFEILFHLIFRPYHSYCIYIDPKTSEDLQKAFRSILKCYQEVFINTTIIIVSGTQPIFHGGFSLLNADLTCLELLYHSSRYLLQKNFIKLIISFLEIFKYFDFSNWDYFINMAGTELPLHDIDIFLNTIKTKNIPVIIESELADSHRINERWGYVHNDEPLTW